MRRLVTAFAVLLGLGMQPVLAEQDSPNVNRLQTNQVLTDVSNSQPANRIGHSARAMRIFDQIASEERGPALRRNTGLALVLYSAKTADGTMLSH